MPAAALIEAVRFFGCVPRFGGAMSVVASMRCNTNFLFVAYAQLEFAGCGPRCSGCRFLWRRSWEERGFRVCGAFSVAVDDDLRKRCELWVELSPTPIPRRLEALHCSLAEKVWIRRLIEDDQGGQEQSITDRHELRVGTEKLARAAGQVAGQLSAEVYGSGQ